MGILLLPLRSMMKIGIILYWLSEHPSIVGFRWSHAQSWGSTWSFLFSSIVLYFLLFAFFYLILHIFNRQTPVPLGPIPAIHSLIMTLLSTIIFVGILLSLAAEIRDTRWFFRLYNTNLFQWFLCFPIGTQPTGRIFFWSYTFYLSCFIHLLRTFFLIMSRPTIAFPGSRIFNNSALVFMTFLWIEFSQSFQVVAILSTTLVYIVVYGYHFWVENGLPVAYFPVVLSCQLLLLGCHLIFHLGVLILHLFRSGCNGIGAWVFNSVLNFRLLFLFLNCYIKTLMMRRKVVTFAGIHSFSGTVLSYASSSSLLLSSFSLRFLIVACCYLKCYGSTK